MKQKEEAERFAAALLRLGVPAASGEAVGDYGWSVRVAGQAGRMIVYWGKNGRKKVSELKGAPPDLLAKLDVAWDGATAVIAAPVEGVAIWVDGSRVQLDSQELLGWGLLIRQDGREVHRASGADIPTEARSMGNISAEIVAVKQALAWCREHGVAEASIHYDYQGLEEWAAGRWRTNNPFTHDYARSVQSSGLSITWVKVKSHAGDPDNTLVDQLAQDAARASKGAVIHIESTRDQRGEIRGGREADYARHLAVLTERWVAYAGVNIEWAPVRQRLAELAGRLGQPAPDSADGPDIWRQLARSLVSILERRTGHDMEAQRT